MEAIGALPFRKADRMGFAGWYNNTSDDLKDVASALGTRLRDSWGFELYYNIAVTPWLHVTADLQFLENARQGDDTAVVPGLRVVIDF